jgi:hypothetical protein
MATEYIDVDREPGIDNVPLSTATSTVTNEVRVAWDTAITRQALVRTLREIADALLNGDKFSDPTHFDGD